ncbi:MAG: MotA/TolQ/ExbB proton channel family protein [Phocaeicola sp.]|uniref:MotA/TolQ/ExbB proton channel family protein n=1 Tax=Phocaeicola TaxID=909656 RepID=UPI00234E3D9A|nr:MotA/TolQ/ExbB proton channel family protein [Phocaeicola oris]MCE2615898.1 MotA/TolQ/ExbB proton channel family protein [Phocaeicola oris]
MNYISNVLYWISTGLLVPVVVLLIIFFIRSILLIGSFFGQYITVKRTNSILKTAINNINADNIENLKEQLPQKNSSLVIEYISRILEAKNSRTHINRLLSEYEIAADKDLSTSKTLIKMGPMLGLMGTLIPMGPALVGLSTGDISSMAYNMQVAFATTVVGLFSSGIGFMTQQVKQRWYVQDLSNLEFISELLKERNNNEKTPVE